MTYGIVYGSTPDTTIIECASLKDAWTQATDISVEQDVDIVVLEGSGPVLDSDGEEVAPTHAPRRTIATLPYVSDERIERFAAECGSAGDTAGYDIAQAALAGDTAARRSCAEMLAEAISQVEA